MSKKYITLIVVVLLSVGLDQWTKQLAVEYLKRPEQGCDRCYSVFNRCTRHCTSKRKQRTGSLMACRKHCDQIHQRCRKQDEKDYKLCRRHYDRVVLPEWRARVKQITGSLQCRRVIQGTHAECVVVEGFFHYKYQINPGAAWGLFSNYPPSFRRPFFISITFVALFFILYIFAFRLENSHRLMIFSLALILGGALGNFLDRLRLDYVIDFIKWYVNYKPFVLDLYLFKWRFSGGYQEWPTFNIADVAISVGVFLIAIELFFFSEDIEDTTPTEEAEGDAATSQPATTPQETISPAESEGEDTDQVEFVETQALLALQNNTAQEEPLDVPLPNDDEKKLTLDDAAQKTTSPNEIPASSSPTEEGNHPTPNEDPSHEMLSAGGGEEKKED